MSQTDLMKPFVPKPDSDYPRNLRAVEATMGALNTRLEMEPTQRAHRNVTTPHLNTKLATAAALHAKVVEDKKAVDSILTSRGLSPEGKVEHLAKDAPKRLEKYEFAGSVLRDTKEAKTRSQRLLLDPITKLPEGMSPTIAYFREAEIRRNIPKTEAEATFLRALASDDLETARAILNAPGLPWISPDIRRRGEEAFMQRTNPELWATIQSLAILQEHLASYVEQLRLWFEAMGLSPAAFTKALRG